jgi:protein-serine/threonine kinase
MAYHHQVTATSLTPSRPAPQAPHRRDTNDTMYSNTSTLTSAGYKTSFSFNPPTASGSSYATSYSGIGASPIRPTASNSNGSGSIGGGMGSNGDVVRSGWAAVKEDSFASLFWLRKWLVLKEEELMIHKSEVRRRQLASLD